MILPLYNLLSGGLPPAQTTWPLSDLPGDVLIEVAEYLAGASDVLHLAQTCKRIYDETCPVLNRSITLGTRPQCLNTLSSFHSKPSLAHHVQTLVLRPDGPAGHDVERHMNTYNGTLAMYDARDVCAALIRVARNLKSLSTFVWDAEERPMNDEMWFVVRMACPLLKNIGCSAGSCIPLSNSHLYNFKYLQGFSLNFKAGFYRDHVNSLWPDEQPSFPELWNMLAHRSPDLERLVLSGSSSEPIDTHALASYKWPALRTLVVGDVLAQTLTVGPPPPVPAPPTPGTTSDEVEDDTNLPPFVRFLLAHPELETMHLGSRAGVSGWQLALLDHRPGALQHLREFAGTLDQASHLPGTVKAQLTTLRLREPVYLREVTPLHVSSVLKMLGSLQRLTLGVVLHSSYDHGGVLRAVVSGAPGLVELEFICAAKPCFLLETVARAIRPLNRLRALHLALVTVPGEEPALDGAAKMARANPRLKRFTITRLPRKTQLPLRLAPSRWVLEDPYTQEDDGHIYAGMSEHGHEQQRMKMGEDELLLPLSPVDQLDALSSTTYTLMRDRHGLPIRLDVHEVCSALRMKVPVPFAASLALARFSLATKFAGLSFPTLFKLSMSTPGSSVARWIGQYLDWPPAKVVRRYTHDLRPVGHPDLKQKGWGELVLQDRTQAGEEARVLVFCVVLGAVAAWTSVNCLAK